MEEFLKTYGPLIAVFTAVGLAIWQSTRGSFKELRDENSKLKDQIHDLGKKIERLETKDELQQSTLAKLPELFPAINNAIEQLRKEKRK